VNGSLNNHQASFFIDNGANTSYMRASMADRLRLKLTPLDKNIGVKMPNGSTVACTHTVVGALVKMSGFVSTHNFLVCPGLEYDVFLGLDWLAANNVLVDHGKRHLHIPFRKKTIIVQCAAPADPALHKIPSLSAMQFKRTVRKSACSPFLMVVRALNEDGTKPGPTVATPDEELQAKCKKLVADYIEDVFPPELPAGVVDRGFEHTIELVKDAQPPATKMFRLSPTEMDALKVQIPELLEKGFIRPSISPFGAPILFVKKKDGSLRMCVDFRPLNNITIKNKYPLPFIDDLLEQAAGCKYFTKIDLRNGYYQVKIAEGDIQKTAFRTRLGHFEWVVLPLGLTNAPATFMHMMNQVFGKFLNKFLVIYLDDLLIFSKTPEEHLEHLELVLKTLKENKLYGSLKKCAFGVREIEFLGHVVSDRGIKVDPAKVAAITSWQNPTSATEVRSFLGLANYYRRFIRGFGGIAAPLTELTKADAPFLWTARCTSAFQQLKQALVEAPVLRAPDPSKPFVLHTDASNYALGAVLMQDFGDGLQPIAYESHRFTDRESEWPTHERELFAIVYALKKWRHYVGMRDVSVYTDHAPLKFIFTQPNLSQKQARWIATLQEYKLDILYKAGPTNVVADALSRRIHLMNLSVSTPTLSDTFLLRMKQAYVLDAEWKTIYHVLTGELKEVPVTLKGRIKRFSLDDNGLIRLDNDRICVPNDKDLRLSVLNDLHDAPQAGHPGIEKTYELVHRYYYWKGLHTFIEKYIKHCTSCQRNKASNTKTAGLLQSMPVPAGRWVHVSCDFIVRLPKTTSGYDAIVVFVDMFSKMAHFIPCTTDITAERTAELFVKHIFRLHGLPAAFTSDRDSKFTSTFWTSVMDHFEVSMKMSSSYHPQTDGQTERVNRILEQTLRHYVDHEQTNWDKYLPLAEFAYNNASHSSTGYSPFYLNYGFHPRGPHDLLKNGLPANAEVKDFLSKMDSLVKIATDRLNEAKDRQTKYANEHRSERIFNKGDFVNVHNDRFHHPEERDRPSRKLGPVFTGPFEIVEVINPVAYRLKLPSNVRTHDVFHVSDLTLHHEANENSKKRFKPLPETIDGHQEFEVEKIVGRDVIQGVVNYQVRFKGYSSSYDLFLPEHELTKCKELIAEFLETTKDPESVLKNVARKARRTKKVEKKAPVKVQPKRNVKKKK